MRIVGAWALLLISVTAIQAQVAHNAPVCMAERHGNALITRIEFPDGYKVEGPWHVTSNVRTRGGTTVTAVLDRIVETRPFTSELQMTSLPSAIEMTFSGRSVNDVLNEAASIWCVTVMKVRQPDGLTPFNGTTTVRERIVM